MIYYVTKDIERAVGIDLNAYPNIYFVSNSSPQADLLAQDFPTRIIVNKNIKLTDFLGREKVSDSQLSTLELLKTFKDKIQGQAQDNVQILVFKNSPQIERFCREQGWQLLNPSAALVNEFERKLSQYEWLKEIPGASYYLPFTRIGKLSDFTFEILSQELGAPFIVQYNTGHTGSGTKVFSNSRELENTQSKFPNRDVRISQYVKGEIYTVNACVINDKILTGAVSQQLTGLKDYTDNPFATVGNDWTAAQDELTSDQVNQIHDLTQEVGQAMAKESWRGLFGIDVILEEETHKLFLIEINARQPASACFETQLAHRQGAQGPMDWHLSALANLKSQYKGQNYELHAKQLILRKKSGPVYEKFKHVLEVGEYSNNLELIQQKSLFDLTASSSKMLLMPNWDHASDFLRIQTQ